MRVVFIAHRSAANGHGDSEVRRLETTLAESLGRGAAVNGFLLESHDAVRDRVESLVRKESRPLVLISGGGGGTLRAVVEGAIAGNGGATPGPERVRFAAVRMGSGNVIARALGVPEDPTAGLRALAAPIRDYRIHWCPALRCEAGNADGGTTVHHAMTFGGFGRLGQVPGDLLAWRRAAGRARRWASRAFGLERVNDLEYAVGHALRCVQAAANPRRAERVELDLGGERVWTRLLSAVAMNLPFRAIPVNPRVQLSDSAFGFAWLPFEGWNFSPRRIQLRRIELGAEAVVRLEDRASAECFLDEDPLVFHRQLKIGIAGPLAFVPVSQAVV